MPRYYWKILLTVLIAGGGFAVLAYQSFGEVVPYAHVDEVLAQPDKYTALPSVQIHGFAHKVPLAASIQGDLAVREFELESKGKTIWVRHEGVVPDTFKELAETVVIGGLVRRPDGSYFLTTVGGERGIMAKCPSKYDGKK